MVLVSVVFAAVTLAAGHATHADDVAAKGTTTVDFGREILPLLSDHCFQCHGPDEKHREAGLRLDSRDGLFGTIDGRRTVAAGQPDQSELMRRLTADDPDEHMPPASTGRSLKPEQIAKIRQWIASGAEWHQHWAFEVPQHPELPKVSNEEWAAQPLDRFVLARLDREQLKPAAPADRRTLLRRVSFDLTGLPPTPDEVRAFLADQSPQAYEKAVDRLLASPRYAEKMAIRWLEAARYADTSGYQSDGPRDMWRWRDWVLDAFHRNMPFDQFTIEQLAGDLLPNRTLNQLIATGFNRNHRGNAEGGIVPEEFQVEYVVDRVDTTFTVWQGLTMGCGRCHSHKYDPISQTEYYRVFAMFNNIPENGRAVKEGNSPPFIKAPTSEQQRELTRLDNDVQKAEALAAELSSRQAQSKPVTSESVQEAGLANWSITDRMVVAFDFDKGLVNSATEAEGETRRSATTVPLATEKAEKIEAYQPRFVEDLKNADAANSAASEANQQKHFVAGQHGQAVSFDGQQFVDAGPIGKLGYFERFTISAWVKQDRHAGGSIVSKMEPVARGAGYSFDVTDEGKVQLNLVKRWLDDSLRVETIEAIPTGRWAHLAVSYDGARVASGISFYVDGKKVEHKANLDGINQTFEVNEPFRIGDGQARFRGQLDEVRIFRRGLEDWQIEVLAEPASIADILKLDEKSRSLSQGNKLHHFLLEAGGPQELVAASRELRARRDERAAFVDSLPTVMVMEEMKKPRETHVLIRGQYNLPGAKVEPGVPACLLVSVPQAANNISTARIDGSNNSPASPESFRSMPRDRLELARWLVSRNNPLTARVTVNRFWRDVFGTGLVKTTEDFGAQGERPSHPELLDWLAVEFMESGWNVKRLMKLIVMSNTYQQSSHVAADLAARDPENRLLARGPRFRLPGEVIRDQALLVSGLLTERLGGPSVKPYQPEGLWAELATDMIYDQSHGPELYRRSLYTYWKRTVLPPMLAGFDSPTRETCEVRQTRTNTPLQALNLLNDVTFVEAARVLAQKLIAQSTTDEDRLRDAFERLFSRPLQPAEQSRLLRSLKAYRERFRSTPDAAKKLLAIGEAPRVADQNNEEVAAWTLLVSTLMNLDEAVTKE